MKKETVIHEENDIITKELVEKLSDEDITRKEYKRIIALINDKVDEIWRFICLVAGRELNWWAFQNDVEYGNGCGSSGGEFDPVVDKTWIEIQGESDHCKLYGYLYNDGFPTNFLWEDYKTIVQDHQEDVEKRHKEKMKQDASNKKLSMQRHLELKKSILSKLTPEEAKIVKFKV